MQIYDFLYHVVFQYIFLLSIQLCCYQLIILSRKHLLHFDDLLRKTVPNARGGDRKSSVTDGWQPRTADNLNSGFLGRLRTTYHRQGNKRLAKRLWACVNAERQHLNTCCNFWYRKIFYYSGIKTLCLKDLHFLFIRQRKLWNDALLRIATVTRFIWYSDMEFS